MIKGFLSVAVRALVNLESLNGVETVGNLSRHRVAPIVLGNGGGYTVKYVPAVSGESLGHAYQHYYVQAGLRMNLSFGARTLRDEFIKYTEDEYLKEEGIQPPKDSDDSRRFEVEVLLKDALADVGGFFYAGKNPVKRTSRFQVGYMIPALREADASALEAQFHARHVPSEGKKSKGQKELGQMPYNVEVGSALYTFTFTLDLDGISVPSAQHGKRNEELERKLESTSEDRKKAAFAALLDLLSGLNFGAKRSRFLPNAEVLSAVATYSSDSIFVVSPGNGKDYLENTRTRASSFRSAYGALFKKEPKISVIAFEGSEKINTKPEEKVESVEALVEKLISLVGSD